MHPKSFPVNGVFCAQSQKFSPSKVLPYTVTVSQEQTNTEIPSNSNSPVLDDTSSDAFLYDSATEVPNTVQNNAASSDSIREQNVTELTVVETLPAPPTSRYPHRESQGHLIVTCNI